MPNKNNFGSSSKSARLLVRDRLGSNCVQKISARLLLGSKVARNFSARNVFLIENDRLEMLEHPKFLLVHIPTIECGPFHAKIVKILLLNGANTNIKDNDELVTPFYCATFKTAKIFFDFAIDLDLNVRDTDTNTPFEYFIKNRIEDEALGISKMIIHHLSC